MTDRLTGIINSAHISLIVKLGLGMSVGALGIWMAPIQKGALMDGLGYSASQSGLLGSIEIFAMSTTAILVSPINFQVALFRDGNKRDCICIDFQLLSVTSGSYPILFIYRLLTGIGWFGLIACSMASFLFVYINADIEQVNYS